MNVVERQRPVAGIATHWREAGQVPDLDLAILDD